MHQISLAASLTSWYNDRQQKKGDDFMVERMNLNAQIYKTLKRDILEQRIGFGEKLVNRDLQERFGVSSTPIRDAINRLHNDGFLENITNGGARVINFDVDMALDVNEIIAALHREAVTMSLNKGHKDELIPILQRCIQQQEQSIDEDIYFMHDKLFHQAFFDYCDNTCLKNIFKHHSGLWELLIFCYYKDKCSDRKQAINEHHNILAACIEGNLSAAHRCLDDHFKSAVDALIKATRKASVR